MKEEGTKGFEKIFGNIIETDPVSYYAIISNKLMEKEENKSNSMAFLAKSNVSALSPKYNFKIEAFVFQSLKRLKIWSLIDYKPLINIESKSLSQINLSPKSNFDKKEFKHVISLLKASIFSETNNHLEGFKVVYRDLSRGVLSFNKEVLDVLYPKPYWDKIQKYSTGMDPIIPLALIRQESAFNPKAQSHVGARGLMQLMPYTAKQFKRNLKVSQLENPNLNLSIGSKYLYNLMKQYDFNLVYTLSAYNAGEGRVKEWRTKYLTNDSILHNIENIPFSETRKYVKLIFRNIFFYKLMNEETINRTIADTDEPNKIFDVYLGFNK
jgi:soluble lytic murein transglycosylase